MLKLNLSTHQKTGGKTNSNTTLVKVKFRICSIIPVHSSNSNTTLVKVKLKASAIPPIIETNSNTTLVKVK